MTAQLLRKLETRIWAERTGHPSLRTRILRAAVTVLHGIGVDRLWVRSGYMTYLSLFYLVPIGAMGIMLSARLGWAAPLTKWIETNLSPTAPKLAANIVEAMNRVDLGTLGIVGIGVVLFAGIFTLIELEIDLGEIWISRAARSWWKRLVFYPLAIVLAPTVIAVILGIATLAEASTTSWIGKLYDMGNVGATLHDLLIELPGLFKIIPYLVTWLMLSALYFFGPVRPVKMTAALVGGIFAGIIWQLAQGAYLNFHFAFSTYREVWGYLAQIPLLLLWIYVTWLIVYLGAETAFAWQYGWSCRPKSLHAPFKSARNPRLPVDVAVYLLRAKSRDVTAVEISAALMIPLSAAESVAEWLDHVGLVVAKRGRQEVTYQTTLELAQTKAAELLQRWQPSLRDVHPSSAQVRETSDEPLAQVAGLDSKQINLEFSHEEKPA